MLIKVLINDVWFNIPKDNFRLRNTVEGESVIEWIDHNLPESLTQEWEARYSHLDFEYDGRRHLFHGLLEDSQNPLIWHGGYQLS